MNAMGRLNASTEIIPLQGPSGRNEARFRQNFRPKPKPYFVDPHIVPRVKQYLEDHKDTVHVDMDAMVDELQRKYKDYARRKRNAFKQSVDKAFKTVLHQYGVSGDYDGGDLENSESSDEEMYSEDVSLENSSNTQAAGQLMNMYMNRPGLSVTPGLRPSDRMNLLSYQRPVLHRLHHHGDGIYIRPSIKQEPLEFRQRGFTAFQRRGEAGGGDKELINISSDEEDGGGGGPKSRGGNAPSSSSVGLLPTPTLGPSPTPTPGPGPGGAMPSLVGQLGGRPGAGPGPGPGPGGAGAGAGAGAGGGSSGGGPRGGAGSGPGAGGAGGAGGGEPSPMRPWPPATPAASSTPRQAKRPRPSGPSSAASSTTTTSAIAASAGPGPGAGAGPGARDSPAVKRRRDAASASAAHGPPLAVEPQEPGVSFADVGGVDDLLEEVGRLLAHLRRPEIFRTLGVPPPRGVLLHGPPGCGKSLLARAVAGELRLPLLRVAGPELVAGVSGESEARVRDLFEQAARSAPCVLFLDEVDALAPPRAGAQREMERRIVAQLLSCLDELGRSGPDSTVPLGAGEVLVLGATSRPEALDPALRRAGRFDREIRLGIPDARAREAILGILCRSMRLAPDVDLHALAKCTPGFVGADLQALTREAALAAVSRVLDDTQRGGAEATKDNEKTAAAEERNDESEAKIKDETKASTSEEKEVSKEEKEETKMDVDKEADQEAKKDTETEKEAKKEVIENKTNETMEVIDISDRDTPNESGSSKTPAAKADSSVTKLVGIDEDEVCIEAEVTSSDAAAKDKTTKGSSTPDADDDMEVLEDELDEEVVPVPASEILHTKSLAANVWNTHFPALTDNQLENMFITQKDFEVALKHVQPSAKREGFATVPDISWDDVGALRDVREELQMAILAPVRHPDAFEALGLTAPAGLLLCGPPGCGKTLIAKAIANEADINFISVKGPELLNMYVGESEKAVRQCFLRARNSAPCVIFFDELDALCPRRTGGPSGEGSSATQRVVNQLLTEMDGVEGRRGVFLLAASNRPDILDPAVLRPGRLDRIVFVGLPGPDARAEILRALTKNGTRPRLAADVDLQTLGESADLEGCSGADLASLIREAATLALREHLVSVPSQPSSNSPRPPPAVAREHLAQAVRRLRPSVSPQERIRYEKLRIQFSSSNPIQVQSNKESPPSPSSSSASSQTAVGGAGTNANEMQTEPPKDLAPSTPADPSVSA